MSNQPLQQPDYKLLDEATSPIQEVLNEIQHFTKGIEDEQANLKMEIDAVKIETPVELDVHVDEAGRVTLGTTSRHTTADVSFEPVLHQLKLTITSNNDAL